LGLGGARAPPSLHVGPPLTSSPQDLEYYQLVSEILIHSHEREATPIVQTLFPSKNARNEFLIHDLTLYPIYTREGGVV
jgi:hypothetical protein